MEPSLYELLHIMNEDSKLNGKYPIFDDILPFTWFKMRLYLRDISNNVIMNFHQATYMLKVRDVLRTLVPENDTRSEA